MANVRQTLHSQLAALIRRKPVTVTPEATVREVVESMSEHRIGSIVVVEPESGRPIGIFTLRDLLHRVAAKGLDLDQMIMSVMSGSGLLTLNWRGTAYQAALVMARHGVPCASLWRDKVREYGACFGGRGVYDHIDDPAYGGERDQRVRCAGHRCAPRGVGTGARDAGMCLRRAECECL